MKFTKMHGLGNDYIYFNGFETEIKDPNSLSVRLSDRHFSIGGDGIVIILPSKIADFRMRMFNADGSEGRMCGNATRCIGKYVYEKGLTDKTDLTLETLSGIKYLHLHTDQKNCVESVSVQMGRAEFTAGKVPVIAETPEVVNAPVHIAGDDWFITCVSVGNPHCVTFVENVKDMALQEIGPRFENFESFPERINTEFVRVIDNSTLEMRVWERGSGETMACGTGACAVASAAVKNGICPAEKPITVKLLGGDLKITVSKDFDVLMEGGASFAFEGEVE